KWIPKCWFKKRTWNCFISSRFTTKHLLRKVTEVDVVGVCQEGKFLLWQLKKQTLLTNAFVQKANDENQCTYRILLGKIVQMKLVKIQQAIEKVDFHMAKKLQGQIKSSFISTENYHTLGCLSLVAGDLASEIPVIIGGTVKSVIDAEIIEGAKKFQLMDNLLFVFDTNNPSSIMWQGVTNLTLVALTTTTTNKMRNLMVYSLPMMEILYSLEVSSVSSLVQTAISTDTIYLLKGICKNDPKLSEDSVSVLVLRCLTEALPEDRLTESFAIQFGLDVELVYKVKSNDILEKLALSSLDTSEQAKWQKLVDEAKENLHKIQDYEFVKILAKWLEQATRDLELTDKAEWPENGLQLAEVFFIAEKPYELGSVTSWCWSSLDYQNTEEVCQLRTLLNNLQELITLHRKYNCNLALSDSEKEDTTTIVFQMFDKVLALELIPSIFEKFISVYMREHDLQEEELLLLNIEDLLTRSWEAKAMAVIGCLSDTDIFFEHVILNQIPNIEIMAKREILRVFLCPCNCKELLLSDLRFRQAFILLLGGITILGKQYFETVTSSKDFAINLCMLEDKRVSVVLSADVNNSMATWILYFGSMMISLKRRTMIPQKNMILGNLQAFSMDPLQHIDKIMSSIDVGINSELEEINGENTRAHRYHAKVPFQAEYLIQDYRYYPVDGYSLLKRFPLHPLTGPRCPVQTVGQWLESIGLPQYENHLMANGFDNVQFMQYVGVQYFFTSMPLVGMEMLISSYSNRDEISMSFIYSDLPVPLWEYFLAEIHLLIAASERKKLSPRKTVANLQEYAQFPILITLQSIVTQIVRMRPIGHDGYHPTSVAEWLDSIELGDYTKAFLINGYTSMDLLKKIWEVELI
ncbi:hypothetical protein EI555_003365, partial [Monodon monoceros]